MRLDRAKPRRRRVLAAAILMWLSFWSAGIRAQVAAADYLQVTGPCGLEFPRDHGPHPGFRTEWWYYTGNLSAETGRRFGFQLTFFRHQLSPLEAASGRQEPQSAWRARQVYLAHAAVTDISGKRHLQFAQASREALGMAGWRRTGEETGVFVGGWSAVFLSDRQYLEASSDDFAFRLELRPVKAPVRHGIDGYSRKGAAPERASCYYSLTRLETVGTVTLADQQTIPVKGLSWMDHEFSTAPLDPGIVGWDWFSIQLSDQSELMIFLLRRADGGIDPVSSGTRVDPYGGARHLGRADFAIEVLDTWKSKRSGAVYPSRWRVRVPSAGVDVMVSANLPDQEMRPGDLAGITYWEGSVAVKGTQQDGAVEGQGYVELTGYAGPVGVLK